MASRGKPTEPWKMIILGMFSLLVIGSCVVSLFRDPLWSTAWFAALAGAGVFLPVLALSIVMLVPGRPGSSKKPSGMGLHAATFIFGGLALAMASAAVSGYIAYTVDGVTSFETGSGTGYRYDLPVPVFIAVMGVCSLAFAAASVLGVRELLRRRTFVKRSAGRRPGREH